MALVDLSCFIPKYIKYEAPTNLTIRNRVDEAINNVPNPRIESSDSMNKPKIFAKDEIDIEQLNFKKFEYTLFAPS
jgi:hypothetical protein